MTRKNRAYHQIFVGPVLPGHKLPGYRINDKNVWRTLVQVATDDNVTLEGVQALIEAEDWKGLAALDPWVVLRIRRYYKPAKPPTNPDLLDADGYVPTLGSGTDGIDVPLALVAQFAALVGEATTAPIVKRLAEFDRWHALQKAEAKADEQATCPNGHKAPKGAKFCPECGSKIAPKAEGEAWICPDGHANPASARYCTDCGAPQTAPTKARKADTTPKAPEATEAPQMGAEALDLNSIVQMLAQLPNAASIGAKLMARKKHGQ